MASNTFLLCSVLLLLLTSTAHGQRCELYDSNIIERLFIAGVEQCHPEIRNITVIEYYINCLASADLRDRFAFTTVTVVFNSSLHPGEEIAYHDIGCTESNVWDITPITPFQGIDIGNGNRNNNTREDCGACATPRVIPIMPPIIYDNISHCYECNVACPDNVGQQRCFGLSKGQCCNFYDEDMCVRECRRNQEPNQALECDCIGFYVEPQCTVCDLTCVNNGTVNNNCTACNCPQQYTGVQCELDFNECTISPCLNGGTCNNTLGSFTCTCPDNFTGRLCEVDVNECTSAPCQNGGTCNNTLGSFTCVCPRNFTGQLCEIDFDECTESPCQNGGTCINTLGSFTCVCPSNFTGQLCDVDVDECVSAPCMNMGTCINNIGGFSCACSSGFTGDRCGIDIDDCTPNPCLSGGTCMDLVANFSCECPPDLGGRICDQCTLANCMSCGRTTGECDQCRSGFLLRAGDCLIDFQEACPQQEQGNFDVNECINLGSLQQWDALVTACNFSAMLTAVPVNSSASEEIRYNATLYSYLQTRNSWRTAAEDAGLALPDDNRQMQSGPVLTVEEWKSLLQKWLADFQVWETAARKLAPMLQIRSTSINLSGNPSQVYSNIISVWNDAATDFANLIAQSQCSL